MFQKILIANRGEIACRIIRTCRKLGVQTVAVYSEADEHALHRKSADEAILIGPAEARKSYLNIERIIQAAMQTGAQAIHPGYGFLSENAEFAKACAKAGIVFIGPPIGAIEAMGSKAAAKRLMVAAGVPVVPGYQGEAQDPALLAAEAERIGFPLLIKASAGGGGKGMRLVTQMADFSAALVSAQREALSSFGDEHVIIERYVESPRHIEVQVFGDSHGNIIHLFERECTLQRRHQKVVEEAPSPTISPEIRQQMGESAVAAARAVDYQGAGTIEFIVGKDGGYYFMEMNTRLQVEHPVTELITGQDLVEWQLRVASGEPIPLGKDALGINGHAIEVRLYAEDPHKGFLPTTGTVQHFVKPSLGHNVRLDAGIQTGDEVKLFYDPMLAKLISWGKTREVARQTLVSALEQMCLFGLTTNQQFLHRLLQHEAYVKNQVDTGFIERELPALTEQLTSVPPTVLATISAMYHQEEAKNLLSAHIKQLGHNSVWSDFSNWNLNNCQHRPLFARINGREHRFAASMTSDSQITIRGEKSSTVRQNDEYTWCVSSSLGEELVYAFPLPGGDQLFHRGVYYVVEREFSYEHQVTSQAGSGSQIVAPMPGKVVKICVEPGSVVSKGDPILILEAMKMENTISAFKDARIAEVFCQIGDQVQEAEVLIALEAVSGINDLEKA